MQTQLFDVNEKMCLSTKQIQDVNEDGHDDNIHADYHVWV